MAYTVTHKLKAIINRRSRIEFNNGVKIESDKGAMIENALQRGNLVRQSMRTIKKQF